MHGYNYSYPCALRDLLRLHRLYALPASLPIRTIVYFTWPSWGRRTRYPSDQAIAQPSGYLLGRIFAKAVHFHMDFFGPGAGRDASPRTAASPKHCGRKMHIAAHSMGNQVLEEFMRAIREHELVMKPLFGEALLLNADADWTALSPDRPLYMLSELSDRVHVYSHAALPAGDPDFAQRVALSILVGDASSILKGCTSIGGGGRGEAAPPGPGVPQFFNPEGVETAKRHSHR